MNRQQRRKAQSIMAKNNAARPPVLLRLPEDQWPPVKGKHPPIECWISRDFFVQVYDFEGYIRVSICRTNIKASGAWQDDITWDDLMQIKREIGRGESYAVEVLPEDSHIVNVANLRHFWIMDEPIVGWRRV